MNKPLFVCGNLSKQPEHPSDWSVQALHGIAQRRTLDGTEVKDLTWRKYQYTLTWDAMSISDYEAMLQLVNKHNDEGLPITFTYGKFASSSSGVEVFVEPLSRARRGGSGSTYYQNVTIVLVEKNSRLS